MEIITLAHNVPITIAADDILKFVYTVDSDYLEFQGTLWNTSRYPYLELPELQKWGKQ